MNDGGIVRMGRVELPFEVDNIFLDVLILRKLALTAEMPWHPL